MRAPSRRSPIPLGHMRNLLPIPGRNPTDHSHSASGRKHSASGREHTQGPSAAFTVPGVLPGSSEAQLDARQRSMRMLELVWLGGGDALDLVQAVIEAGASEVEWLRAALQLVPQKQPKGTRVRMTEEGKSEQPSAGPQHADAGEGRRAQGVLGMLSESAGVAAEGVDARMHNPPPRRRKGDTSAGEADGGAVADAAVADGGAVADAAVADGGAVADAAVADGGAVADAAVGGQRKVKKAGKCGKREADVAPTAVPAVLDNDDGAKAEREAERERAAAEAEQKAERKPKREAERKAERKAERNAERKRKRAAADAAAEEEQCGAEAHTCRAGAAWWEGQRAAGPEARAEAGVSGAGGGQRGSGGGRGGRGGGARAGREARAEAAVSGAGGGQRGSGGGRGAAEGARVRVGKRARKLACREQEGGSVEVAGEGGAAEGARVRVWKRARKLACREQEGGSVEAAGKGGQRRGRACGWMARRRGRRQRENVPQIKLSERLGWAPEAVGGVHWLRMILDEGHVLGRSAQTNRGAILSAIRAERRWVMTCTPAPHTAEPRHAAAAAALVPALPAVPRPSRRARV
eukprot:jgi/Ulvmu1/9557/UM053_0046.1